MRNRQIALLVLFGCVQTSSAVAEPVSPDSFDRAVAMIPDDCPDNAKLLLQRLFTKPPRNVPETRYTELSKQFAVLAEAEKKTVCDVCVCAQGISPNNSPFVWKVPRASASEEAKRMLLMAGEIASASLVDGMMNGETQWTRGNAALALAQSKEAFDVPVDLLGRAFVKGLGDPSYYVREKTVRAVHARGSRDHVPVLRPLLDSEEAVTRAAAVAALGPIAPRHAIRGLDDPDAMVRRSAVWVAGHRPEECRDAGPKLVRILENDGPAIRAEVVLALGEVGGWSTVPPLIGVLRSENEDVPNPTHVRRTAIEALGKIKDARATPALVEVLGDDGLAHVAIIALAGIRDRTAVPALIAELRSKHSLEVVRALQAIGDDRAVPPLVELFEPEHPHSSDILLALASFNDPRATAKLTKTYFTKEGVHLQDEIRDTLARIQDPQLIESCVDAWPRGLEWEEPGRALMLRLTGVTGSRSNWQKYRSAPAD